MKGFVYVGGTVFPDGFIEMPRTGDFTVAADCGYRNAEQLGITPMLCVGDFDSSAAPTGICLCTLPCEKDDTDGQHALREAFAREVDEIVIVGGMSGRVDHTLACLAMLEECHERGIPARMTDGHNRVRFLKADSMRVERSGFHYLSLVALDETVDGITLTGCRYPLENGTLSRYNQYAVSNEITEEYATVTVGRGAVYVIESNG